MDFVFSNAPSRIVAMTRPMAWATLDEGHAIFEERTQFEDGAWRMELQNPALEVPKNPFVYGHTGTVEAIAGGNAPDGWRVAWFRFFDRTGGSAKPRQLLLDAIGVPVINTDL